MLTLALLSLLSACTSANRFEPAIIAPPSSIEATMPDDSVKLMVLAVNYLRRTIPDGELLVEAVPEALTGQVATALRSRSSTRAEAVSCDPASGPAGCRIKGAASFARVAAPVVAGTTATVRVDIWYEHDSARQAIVMRKYLVRFEREGSTWRVSSQELVETT